MFRLASSEFARRTVTLQIGSIGAMLVQAVANILVARYVGPDQFGRYAIAMSLAAIGSVFLGAGAADAMAPVASRAQHRGDAEGLRSAFLFLGKFVLVSGITVIVLGTLMPFLAERFYGDAGVGIFGFIVLIASALSTILLTPAQLGSQVFKRIGMLSALTFVDQAVRQAFVVGLVFAGFGIAGASAGHALGAVLVFGVSALAWRALRRGGAGLPTLADFWTARPTDGRQYIAPALWVLADRNIAMLYGAAPVALAGLFLTTADVSYFKIAFGWITLVLSVLGPVSVLLNTELAHIQAERPERLAGAFAKVTAAGVAVSCAATVVAALISRPVFNILYGAAYAPAAPLTYWLIPFGVFFGFGVALGPLWRALNQVRTSIVINVCVLIVGTPIGMLAMRWWGAGGAIALVTGWYAISHVASFAYLQRALKTTR
ncbi:MAG: oligosaccharide flippase family protein [Candidatus Yanofskybacteria bacterium]|nr:oligosaccharide flippase family protein [Candidatus Yanofskybacteria bacterium]